MYNRLLFWSLPSLVRHETRKVLFQ